MKSRHVFYLFALGILSLIVASIVLAAIFFGMLPGATPPPAPPPQVKAPAPPSPAPPPPAVTETPPAVEPAPVRLTPQGPSGRDRKYGLKTPGQPPAPTGPAPEAATPTVKEGAPVAAEGLPLAFEIDCDEHGEPFDFLARGSAFNVYLGPGELVMVLTRPEVLLQEGEELEQSDRGTTVKAQDLDREIIIRMRMLGVSPSAMATALEAYSGRTHYLLGNDPRRWLHDVPAYRRVMYHDIYSGIDVLFYGDRDRLEYVFVVQPGGDISDVRFTFEGNEGLWIDEDGSLVIEFECGKIVQRAPLFYQVVDDVARLVGGSFVLEGDVVRLEPGPYDEHVPLHVAPTIDFLTYLGGPGDDRAYAMAVDANGYAYVAGETTQPGFKAPGQKSVQGQPDAVSVFVTKFRVADSEPVYTTFLGGTSADRPFGLTVDAQGRVSVCGETASPDFPGDDLLGADRSGGSWDAFVTTLGPYGSNIVMSARIGGSGDDRAYDIASGPQGDLYLGGETSSEDFPTINALASKHGGGAWDGFVVKMDAGRPQARFATTFGGSGADSVYALAVDPKGCVYLAGATDSRDLPLAYAFQPRFAGGMCDGFVAKLSPSGQAISFSSYLGGSSDDRLYGLGVNDEGCTYVAGETASRDLPVTNAIQTTHGGGDWDAVAGLLRCDGRQPIFLTYFGGPGNDRAFAAAADGSRRLHLVGTTSSTNLPVTAAYQASFSGGLSDGFLLRLHPDGIGIDRCTYVGGSREDALYGVATDAGRATYGAGMTASHDVPVINALQNIQHDGAHDAMAVKIPQPHSPEPELMPVRAGGQPGGPDYDFYVSRFEVTNDEFVRFLNDAQLYPNGLRGTNMFFDAEGNVWFNPLMHPDNHEMFSIRDSRIVYDPTKAPGHRYAVTDRAAPIGGTYARHPVVGVTWVGAVKYCNWLTMDVGRGVDERCYTEGTNLWDWAPVSATTNDWRRGIFAAPQRKAWLESGGFRLLMDNGSSTESRPNPFNEFLKAAAWNGRTNALFGYGLNVRDPWCANYLSDEALLPRDTAPVGFFDGMMHKGGLQTHSNENLYGIYDLSGNVSEWLNDPASTNAPRSRAVAGGSWRFTLPTLQERTYVAPFTSDRFSGFRVSTTVARGTLFLVRVPFEICTCRYGRIGEEEEEEEAEEGPEVTEPYALEPYTVEEGPPGVLYQPLPPPIPIPPTFVPPTFVPSPESPGGGGGGGGDDDG